MLPDVYLVLLGLNQRMEVSSIAKIEKNQDWYRPVSKVVQGCSNHLNVLDGLIFMSPPCHFYIIPVFPIYRILYSIGIGSILNIKKHYFDKIYQNTHSPIPSQSLWNGPFLLRFYVPQIWSVFYVYKNICQVIKYRHKVRASQPILCLFLMG